MSFCTKCGKHNDGTGKFCEGCGAPLDPVVAPNENAAADAQNVAAPAEQPVQPVEQPVEPAPTGVRGKIFAARNKVSAFEQKHSVIVNALLAICSLVIMLVTMLAPVKVMAYTERYGSVQDDETSYHVVEIEQPIWNFVEALGYIGLDSYNVKDMLKIAEIQAEYEAAMDGNYFDEDGFDEEDFAEDLSEVNYIAYIMAMNSKDGFSSLFTSVGGAAFMTMVFGVVVFILAVVMAIMSLVNLIYAIVGLAKKKPTKSLFKYMFSMMGLAVSSLSLLAIAPMTKAGGSMFAVLLFGAILMLILGAGSALVMGRNGIATTVKRAAISLVMLISTCLLFTNVLMVPSADKSYDINLPYGYGIHYLFLAIANGSSTSLGLSIGPALIAILGSALIGYAGNALNYSLKALCGWDSERSESKSFNNSICLVVFSVISIVFAFVGAPQISKAINGFGTGDPTMYIRAQVYVSTVFFLAAAIVIKAFKPKDKPLFGAPSLVAATANGAPAPAPENNGTPVNSVENVAEPVVDDSAENVAPATSVEDVPEPVVDDSAEQND